MRRPHHVSKYCHCRPAVALFLGGSKYKAYSLTTRIYADSDPTDPVLS